MCVAWGFWIWTDFTALGLVSVMRGYTRDGSGCPLPGDGHSRRIMWERRPIRSSLINYSVSLSQSTWEGKYGEVFGLLMRDELLLVKNHVSCSIWCVFVFWECKDMRRSGWCLTLYIFLCLLPCTIDCSKCHLQCRSSSESAAVASWIESIVWLAQCVLYYPSESSAMDALTCT